MHALLLCLYVVLQLVADNRDEVSLRHAWRALPTLLGLTSLAWVLLRPLLGSWRTAALGTSLGLVLVFSFDAVLELLTGDAPGRVVPTSLVLLGLELALVLVSFVALRRFAARTRPLTRFMNILATLLVLFAAAEFAWFAWRSGTPPPSVAEPGILQAAPAQSVALDASRRPLRDIYLILLDGYARSDVLHHIYGHDNSAFVGALQECGFSVSPDSYSNYLSTKLVLPALLNMRYLDDLARQYGRHYPNVRPLVREIQHNRVVASLRDIGYRIVNIQSDVDYTGLAQTDEVIAWTGTWWYPNPLETALIDMTPLRRWRQSQAWSTPTSPESRRHDQVLFNIDQLGKQGRTRGPKFVFAHIMSPHQPFVFDRDGRLRTLDFRMVMFQDQGPERERALKQAYAEQIEALNREILEAVHRILSESTVEPIILLLGDHGLRLYLRDRPEDSCLQESFAILYALHLPDSAIPASALPRTPVNTFRMVFDTYFGTHLGALPDKAYFAHRRTSYYSYVDVTPEVETCRPFDDPGR